MRNGRNSGLRAIEGLARILLSVPPGEKIPTTMEFQRELGVGSGTVQTAMRALVNSGAVSLHARGHLGTFVEDVNVPALWSASRLGAPHVALPPIGSRETLAIALGFTEELRRHANLPTFGYHPGAASRFRKLGNGVDLTAMSSGAAAHLDVSSSGNLTLPLGPFSYYQLGSIVRVTRPGVEGTRRQRVVIDRNSVDHERLTLAEFTDQNVQFADGDFRRIPALILEGFADAGLWHRTELLITPEHAGLVVEPIGESAARLAEELSEAVLVARVDSPASALLRAVELRVLTRIRNEVMSSSDVSELLGFGASREDRASLTLTD